jgi:hypothetical protein
MINAYSGVEADYFSRYLGYTSTVTKAVNSVLGYTPTVPHWGWNGNARRYWDNMWESFTSILTNPFNF